MLILDLYSTSLMGPRTPSNAPRNQSYLLLKATRYPALPAFCREHAVYLCHRFIFITNVILLRLCSRDVLVRQTDTVIEM